MLIAEIKKSSEAWLKEPKFEDITVLDPDGWDRRNFKASWAEEITESEFEARLMNSTCYWRRPH